jgi:hypothetical protein
VVVVRLPTRVRLDQNLGDVIGEALREGEEVRLENTDDGLAVVVDLEDEDREVELGRGLPWETFNFPLKRIDLDADAEALTEQYRAQKRRRRFRRRMAALNTDPQVYAEGVDLPIDAEVEERGSA